MSELDIAGLREVMDHDLLLEQWDAAGQTVAATWVG